MNRFLHVGFALLTAHLALSASAFAAKSLDELLEQTRTAHEQEKRENADRERQFQANRDQQAALLAQAEAQRKAAEAHSQQLSAQLRAYGGVSGAKSLACRVHFGRTPSGAAHAAKTAAAATPQSRADLLICVGASISREGSPRAQWRSAAADRARG